jgi:hypothetical protein
MTPGLKARLLALGIKKLVVGAAAAIAIMGALGVAAETGTLTASPSPAPTPTASTVAASATTLPAANAGGKNVVQVVNRTDGAFRVDGKVQLNRIPATNAGPVNLALAYSQCRDCQTLALALQINLISTHTHSVQPQNGATAVNVQCDGCLTVARAIQYNISVDDPTNVPPSVNQLIARMKAELATIKTSSTSVANAESRFNAVISQFRDLAAYFKDARDQQTAPTTPGASPIPASSPQSTPSPSPSATVTPQPTPTTSP